MTIGDVTVKDKDRVAVVGATGHTGRFVVCELARRGFTPVAVGRDAVRLADTAFRSDDDVVRRTVAIEDKDALAEAFADVAAVINCAGPFLDTADAVVAAALAAQAHYLDVTAEQMAAKHVFDRFGDRARNAGVIVVPAMGFFGGFVDLLVSAAMGEWREIDAVEIGVGLDSWHPTSGTRATGERNTATRVVVAAGELTTVETPTAQRAWDFGDPIGTQSVFEAPLSEMILLNRHVDAREIHTYLSGIGLSDIRDPSTPPPKPVDASGRSAQRFVVQAIVTRGRDRRRITAIGQDIYAFTAPLVCEAAQRILAHEDCPAGVYAPAEIFDPPGFLRALETDNLVVMR